MIGEIYLKTKSICIPLAFISTSYLLKGKFRLLSLKIFHTKVISHISSQNQVMIGLQIYFRQLTHRLLRKAITLEFALSKPASLGNCMLAKDATINNISHLSYLFSRKWLVLAAKYYTSQKIIHNSVKTYDILMK